ncbi:ATPase [Patiriisocius marinistellae]|uniref:ATPase n=1 Tax=Patiriisocius marinistellae TaxID=2494560 RepID=A0A5J4FXV4_9FLAO|nr:ATP-binding protein [Patiriisocius marinistellae]GEQ86012.1 ATPase [Patiriisocius marinistellae]
MKPKKIVITGGPGSGKTVVIEHLEMLGHTCMPEISRSVINEARKDGIDQLFLTDPLLFSQKLLDGRLKQFKEGENYNQSHLFYDRGMPDVTAYMDFVNSEYTAQFEQPCFDYKYDIVFIMPAWKEIYTQDSERYENFEQAQSIQNHLRDGYKKYGYNVIEVPFDTIENRAQFILNYLKQN